MKPEVRDFIGKHQTFFEAMRKEKSVADIAKRMGMSLPSAYKALEDAAKYGVVKKKRRNQFEVVLGNFAGIYLTEEKIQGGVFDAEGNELIFQVNKTAESLTKKQAVRNMIDTLKQAYPFEYAAVMVDIGVNDKEEYIGLSSSSNMYDMYASLILGKEDCVFVNSNTIKTIYIKEHEVLSRGKRNLAYYDLQRRQFSVIEDNQLRERRYDEYYGILPYFKEKNDILQRLAELEGEEYNVYYQENKEEIFSRFKYDIVAIMCLFRPDILYLTDEVLKPTYAKDIWSDFENKWFFEILGEKEYNTYLKQYSITHISDRDLLKSVAKYAQYSYFNWKLHW